MRQKMEVPIIIAYVYELSQLMFLIIIDDSWFSLIIGQNVSRTSTADLVSS